MPDRCMRFCRQEIDLLYLLSSTPVCQCAGKEKKNKPMNPLGPVQRDAQSCLANKIKWSYELKHFLRGKSI